MRSVAPEKIGRLLADGLEALTLEHWAEVDEPAGAPPLRVDYDRLMQLERQGLFQGFGARVNGRLVGYSGFVIAPAFHNRDLLALNDVIYVQRPWRGKLAVELITGAERHFVACGIARVSYQIPTAEICEGACVYATVNRTLRRLGYGAVEVLHAKRIGTGHGRRPQQSSKPISADVGTRG